MSIVNFISEIFGSTQKERLIKAIDDTANIARNEAIQAVSLDSLTYAKSPAYVLVEKELKTNAASRSEYKGDLFRYIKDGIENFVEERERIVRIYQDAFRDEINADALSLRQANLAQLVAGYTFFIDYAMALSFVTTADLVKDEYNKAAVYKFYMDIVKNRDNLKAFAIMSTIVRKKAKDIDKALRNLKSISFEKDKAEIVFRTMGDKADPLELNRLPFIGDAVLFVGEIYIAWQKFRHSRAEVLLDTVRMNVMLLEKKRRETTDPAELESIKDQLDHYYGRVSTLEKHIEDIENAF